MFKKLILALTVLGTFACSQEPKKEDIEQAMSVEATKLVSSVDLEKLQSIVNKRSDEDKARDDARKPIQTLEFFQVAPGMSVAEALPGGGWYSKILAPYLGIEGELYGINYNDDMWARFGFFSEERIQESIARTSEFPSMVSGFVVEAPTLRGFTFSSVPDELKGTVDRVLFIRALHNLSRFENEAGTMTEAITSAKVLLKEDGLVGVVQHQAPEINSDEWASGSAGYLKKSAVIEAFEIAGFELVSESMINENPNDVPSEDDIVWRLPPSYNGVADDAALKAEVDAIGESNRMTLLFKKAK